MALIDRLWCFFGRHGKTATKVIGVRKDRVVSLRKVTICVTCGKVLSSEKEIGKIRSRKK